MYWGLLLDSYTGGGGGFALTWDSRVDTTVGVTARPTKGAFMMQIVVLYSIETDQ